MLRRLFARRRRRPWHPAPLARLGVRAVNRVRTELKDELAGRGYQPGALDGQQAQDVLHAAVVFYLERLEAKLAALRPFETTHELMARYELFLGATGHGAGVVSRDLNTIAIASRFCVEVAAARPPSGTMRITDEAYEELVVTAAEIVNHGIYSDLLHTGAVGVSVWIDEDGYLSNVPEREGDMRLVAFAQRWSEGSPNHMLARWQHRPVSDEAMIAEFGVNYEDLFIAVDGIRHAPGGFVRATPAETLRRELTDQLSAEVAEAIFARLTLGPRAQFTAPPAPYLVADTFPWSFGRRLSYLHCPIVRVVDEEGTEWCAWTRRHIDGAALLFFATLRDGRYKAFSPELTDWSEETRQAFAAMLNAEIAEALRAHERFVVAEQVAQIGGVALRDDAGNDLGDIDVLAVDVADAVIYAIEAKDFAAGFTPNAFTSSVERLREAVAKHTRRVDWLQTNIDAVIASVGGDQKRTWQVRPMVVLDEDVAGAYLEDQQMQVTTIERLRASLEADGTLSGAVPPQVVID